ncbi:MAG: penicillin-binding protein 1A [Leptolyngbyaceae cyanobacterium bins.302]|nr:penicillin-binding protein 1A [Leptolyngbyaceae cyanobacterium bins.302]
MSSNTLRQNRPSTPNPTPFLNFVGTVGKVTGGIILGATMLTSSIIAGGLVGLAISFRNLPDVRVLRSYAPTETTHIYDVQGKLLASLHGEANREVIPLDKISPDLKRAVLAIEDSYFFQHKGVNPGAIVRAFRANWQEGRTVEGGSTLTMQLVKNLFLSPKQAFSRKLAESVLSMRVEQIFTKEQILEMYLNQVYWGHNTYGAETAAQSYFGKSAANLNLAEASLMAGLIQAPESLSPFANLKLAKKRQLEVLNRMQELNWITPTEKTAALNQPIKLGKITSFQTSQIPYVTEAAVQELTRRFGRDAVLKGGMRVQTTVDTKLQRIAEEVVRQGHESLLAQGVYADQMALVAVDPRTQFVKAMVGGVDYRKSQYNRAIQALRQPGSAFKPFVYYAAFATGKYGPDSTVYDSPVGYPDGYEMYYPQNYDGSFSGAISIRQALAVSRNVPAVKLGQEVGLNKVIDAVRTIGIRSPIEPVVSLPLGSVDLTPLEMAGAYATFANNGWYSETTFIVQVTDSAGNMLLDNTPKPQLVLDPWASASLNDVLQDVIERGTATAANIGRPAAGKTGTTSSERDIWFVGYVPQLSTAVWVGNDDYSPIGYGATGGTYVAPIWRNFMSRALQGVPVESFRPASNFPKP